MERLNVSGKENTTVTKEVFNKKKFTNGIKNWAILFLICVGTSEVIDNYITYGIIKSPIEFTYIFIKFMIKWGWVFYVSLGIFISQFYGCIVIEKLLLRKFLPEKVGFVLHALNTVFVLNIMAAICTMTYFNCVAGTWLTGSYFLITIKFWSYASVNRKHRLRYRRKDKKWQNNFGYPNNINLKELFNFVIGTGSFVYKIEAPKEQQHQDVKRRLFLIAYAILLHYITAFIIYQYAIPISNELVAYYDNRQFLQFVRSYLRLLVIVCVVFMLIFYYYTYKCFLPFLTVLYGNKTAPYALDWYNCENISIFWQKWNIQTHYLFKEHIFLPMIESGYSKTTASVVVGLISGILHEYFVTVPFRCCYGLATVAMVSQVFSGKVTSHIQKKYGDNLGNFASLAIHFTGQATCYWIIYYNYVHNNYLQIYIHY